MKRHIIALIVISAACVLFGFAVHYHFFGLCFKPEVEPVETATLALATYIAVSLQDLFATKSANTRVEKDIVIDEFRDSLIHLRACRDALASCQSAAKINEKQKGALLSALRRLANTLESAENTLKLSCCSNLEPSLQKVTEGYLQFKKAATGYQFPIGAYSKDQLSDQTKAHRDLHSRIQELIFLINKHT